MSEPVDIESLWVAVISSEPIEREWDADSLVSEAWSFTESFTYDLDERSVVLVTHNGSSTSRVVIDEQTWDLWDHDEYAEACESRGEEPALSEEDFQALADVEPVMHGADGPMMNYWYPVPIDDATEAAAKLAHLPLCVVEVDGQMGLALTGGGMDMSWEIVAAHVALGYLPPARFADLPSQGRGKSEADQVLVAACLRTLTVLRDRAQRDIEHLTERAASWKANAGY